MKKGNNKLNEANESVKRLLAHWETYLKDAGMPLEEFLEIIIKFASKNGEPTLDEFMLIFSPYLKRSN